ncbi:MAG: MgtC/SapB family protein, partial [Rikenellaceae bacterium]|nr:MgtC/SapB family protein [Rikenellaceae bacterium]
GIGFIGAGTILFLKQGAVRGLTTAAGLWTVAAIGLATGGGLYFAAGATTIIALIILWVLQPIERAYSKRFKHKTLRVVTTLDADTTSLLNDLFNRFQTKITDFSLNRLGDEFVYQMKIDNSNLDSIDDLLRELKKNSSVKEIDWT